MPTEMIQQKAFSTGEVDIQTWKRTDAEKLYLTAAQSLLNFQIGTTSLVNKRPGSDLVSLVTAYATVNSRMYEFIDKNGTYYIVMSADQHFYVFTVPTDVEYVVTESGDFVVTIDGDNVIAFSETASLVATISTPYRVSDLTQIDYTEDNDSLILTHPNFAPGRIYVSDYATLTFAFQYLDIYPYPTYDFNTINYAGFTAIFTNPTASTFRLVLNGVGAGSFTTDWINGQIVSLGTNSNNALGYGYITGVTPGSNTVQFDGTVVEPFVAAADMPTVGSQYVIRQPAWSATLGYPAKCFYYQNRLWLANTKSLQDTIFGSKINAPINYDVGTGRDPDAIVYTLGQTNSGEIRWINGGKQLEIYTANYEFVCPQNENVGLTPSTFAVRQQSSYGSSPILKPVTYLNDSYFVSRTGKSIINFKFTGVGLAYESTNISAASSHLVKNPSNRALLRGTDTNQDNFIYFCNPDDDTLTTFQFAEQVNLAALTPAEFQLDDDGNGLVDIVDIVSVDNTIYLLKHYTANDEYTIEMMNNSTKMDNTRDGEMASTGLVTGQDSLNGYIAAIVYEGQDFGLSMQYVDGELQVAPVQDGQFYVFNPDEIADTVQVGLLYDVELSPMYFFSGANQSPFFKQVSMIYVDYIDSLNFYIDGYLVPYQNYADIQAGLPLTPQTGTAIYRPVSGYDRFSTFTITQSSPLDLTIAGIAYQVKSAVIGGK